MPGGGQTSVKKAIDNSKRKRDFKKRSSRRQESSNKRKHQESDKYVQRKRVKQENVDKVGKVNEDDDIDQYIEEEDKELEAELARDKDLGDQESFDDAEFDKYGDELDIPDDLDELSGEEDLEKDAEGDATDSDLEEYYRELGIQDEEDLTKKGAKSESKDQYKTKKKSKI